MSILAIAVIATIYSTGAFVPQTHGVEKTVAGLEALSDAEMTQQVGGPWTSKFIKWSSGEYADCQIYNCPDDTYLYNHTKYGCKACENDFDSKYNTIRRPLVTKSWCDDYYVEWWREGVEEPRCDYESSTEKWYYPCDDQYGACGDHDFGGNYRYY